jgi:hypothetical protein
MSRPCNDNFLAPLDGFEEAGKIRFGFVNIDSLHGDS